MEKESEHRWESGPEKKHVALCMEVKQMSMYGEDHHGSVREGLYYAMRDFLQEYPLYELLETLASLVENEMPEGKE